MASRLGAFADTVQKTVLETLWNERTKSFGVLKLNKTKYKDHGPKAEDEHWWDYACGVEGPHEQHNNCSSDLWPCEAVADARELFGLSPWFFGVVPNDENSDFEAAWASLDEFAAGAGCVSSNVRVF